MLGGAFSILGGSPCPLGDAWHLCLEPPGPCWYLQTCCIPIFGGGGFIPVVCCVSGVATGAVFLFSFKCSLDI